MSKVQTEINIDSNKFIEKVFFFLLSVELFVVFIDIVFNRMALINIGAIKRMCNIAREDSFGTWLSSFQLLAVSFVLFLILLAAKHAKENKKDLWGWGLLTGFYLFMSIDDSIKFHERIGTMVKVIFKRMAKSGDDSLLSFFPTYTWQLVFGPFFAFMGLFIAYFLYKKLKGTPAFKWIIFALTCYVSAVCLDFVEGLDNHPYKSIAYFFKVKEGSISHYSRVIEEFLELFGTTCFLRAYMYPLSQYKNWKIKFN